MIFIFTNRDLWSRWFHAFCGGVMVMLGGPWCPANQLIDSSNDSCRHSVSCNRQLHWMTSWEAGAGWYQPAIMRIYIIQHQQFWNIWKLPPGLNYDETNSSRCDMLRNGIWWLGRVEFLPESFKHLICSRIRLSTVAWSNGSPWHAKPPPRRSGKLPSAGNEKPNGGYTPGFEEISFPFLSIATFKNKKYCIIYIYIIYI